MKQYVYPSLPYFSTKVTVATYCMIAPVLNHKYTYGKARVSDKVHSTSQGLAQHAHILGRVYAIIASEWRINQYYDNKVGEFTSHCVVYHWAAEKEAYINGSGDCLEGIFIEPVSPEDAEASSKEVRNTANHWNIGVIFYWCKSVTFVVEGKEKPKGRWHGQNDYQNMKILWVIVRLLLNRYKKSFFDNFYSLS